MGASTCVGVGGRDNEEDAAGAEVGELRISDCDGVEAERGRSGDADEE